MTPDERIAKLVNNWTGDTYSLSHEELVTLIEEVECDVLDWQAAELEKLKQGMTHDRYAGDFWIEAGEERPGDRT